MMKVQWLTGVWSSVVFQLNRRWRTRRIGDRSLRRTRRRFSQVPTTQPLESRMLLSAAPTSISVVAQHSTSTYGQSETLVALVSSSGGRVTDGTVTFFNGSTPLGTRPVSHGAATLTTTELPAGIDVISATYGGSAKFLASTLAFGPSSIITTVAGNGGFGSSGDDGPARESSLAFPQGVAVDSEGNVFIADTSNHRIRMIDARTHTITTVAGNGVSGYSGDNGLATDASLSGPTSVTVDSNGNLFIVDFGNNRVREVDLKSHVITTVAGNGILGFSGDDGIATDASLAGPTDVAVDTFGNLFIADLGNNRIREVNAATHVITTIAGDGHFGFSGDNVAATNASLAHPYSVEVDSAGNLFIGDNGNNRIREVDATTHLITTVAGNGSFGFSGDNGAATEASLASPTGIAIDSAGNLFIGDYGTNRIRKVSAATHIITTVAGNGNFGFSGDGGPAANASLRQPVGVAVDGAGNLFIADTTNNHIREVVSSATVRATVAKASSTTVTHGAGPFVYDGLPHAGGSGTVTGAGGLNTDATYLTYSRNPNGSGSANLTDVGTYYVTAHYAGDVNHTGSDGTAIAILIQARTSISVAAKDPTLTFGQDETLTATVTSSYGTVSEGMVTFYQGSKSLGSAKVINGTATLTTTALLAGINVITASYEGSEKFLGSTSIVTTSSIITTIAGNGVNGFSGDNGAAADATLSSPGAVAIDADGNVFVVDTANHRIRRIDATTHVITTVAGNGNVGFSGDEGLATDAVLAYPSSIAVDSAGNLFIADTGNNRIRKVDSQTHSITTIAGIGIYGFTGDAGLAKFAFLAFPTGLAIDSDGNLIIADTGNNRIRKVDAKTNVITTIAGSGGDGYSGDGGPATDAQLAYPSSIAVDSAGNLFISDTDNNRIRKVDSQTHLITTIAGNGNAGFSGDVGPATQASLNHPSSIALGSAGTLFIADYGNARIREVNLTTNVITTFAGNGNIEFSGDHGISTNAGLAYPEGVAVDRAGNLLIADTLNNRIREVFSSDGVNITVAKASTTTTTIGAGPFAYDGLPHAVGSGTVTGAGGLSTAATSFTYSANADGTGTANLTDPGTFYVTAHYAGDANHTASDGAAVPITIQIPTSMSVIANLAELTYGQPELLTATITSQFGTVTEGTVTFFNGATPLATVPVSNGTATLTTSFPAGVFFITASYSGNLAFVGTTSELSPSNIITTFAGNGRIGFSGDNGPATEASLNSPVAVAVDSAGNIFFADVLNQRIRRIDAATHVITTVAGNGEEGFSGDGGPATNANLNTPVAIAVDSSGNLFIADLGNNRIRKVDAATQFISTVAGNGDYGFAGDNGPASSATLNQPFGVAVDSAGNLFISDTGNDRIREVSAITHVISTVVGNGNPGFSGDGGPATQARLKAPRTIVVDSAGDLMLVDAGNFRIRKVNATTHRITTVAGNGEFELSEDFGVATDASLGSVLGLAVDFAGHIFIDSDSQNRIRKIELTTNVITTVAGNGGVRFSGDNGPGQDAGLGFPQGIAVDSVGNLFIADTGFHRIRKVLTSHALIVAKAPTTTTTIGTGPFTYDGLPHVGGSGAVTGFDLTTNDVTLTYSANADGTGIADLTDAGTYYVTAHYAGDANHAPSHGNPVAITILPATLTISASPNTKVYDGTTTAGAIPTVTGLIGNDCVTGMSEAYESEDVFGTDGSILQVQPGFTINDGHGGSNYAVTFINAPGTITPATITVSALPYTKVYDGTTTANPVPTGLFGSDTFVNFSESYQSKNVLGDGKSLLRLNPGFSIDDGNGGKDYQIRLGAMTAPGTITPATLWVEASFQEKIYDGTTNATATPLVSGLAASDTLTVVERFASKNASYPIPVPISIESYRLNDGNQGRNYVVNTIAGVGLIHPATLTIAARSTAKTYDGTTNTSTIPTVTGLKSTDTVTGLSEAFQSRNVLGTAQSLLAVNSGYTVNDGNDGNNYNLKVIIAAGTIRPATLTITATTDSKVYDGTTSSTAIPTVSGLFGNDAVSGLSESYGSKNVLGDGKSSLRVNSDFTVSDGNDGRNYTVRKIAAAGTITPASLRIEARFLSKTYDGTTNANIVPDVSGLIGSDTATAVERFDSKNASDNASISIASYRLNDGNQGRNYAVTTIAGVGVISPATLTISARSTAKTYDGTTNTSTLPTVTGLMRNDSVSGLSEAFQFRNVLGTAQSLLAVNSGYTVNDGNGGNNYRINLNTATGTIRPALLTITATSDSKVYDGTTSSAAIPTVTGLVDTDVVLGLSQSFGSKNVFGDGKSSLLVNSNFTLSDGNDGRNYSVRKIAATGAITPAPLTISATTNTKTYDGKNSAAAVPTVSGLFGFIDTVKATQIYQSIHALGEGGSTLIVSAFTINDGNLGRNYVVTLNTATGTINKANATLTITPYNVPFDGRSHQAKGTAKGVLGESLTGLDLSRTIHTAVGTYADTWTFTDRTGDYNDASGTIVDVIRR